MRTSLSLGTMFGKQADSCFGAQKAMAPANSDNCCSLFLNTVHRFLPWIEGVNMVLFTYDAIKR